MNKRLKAFLDDENVYQKLVESSVLPQDLAGLFWDAKVVETKTLLRKNMNARRITATIPAYQRIALVKGTSIRLGVGKPSGSAVFHMQMAYYDHAEQPERSRWWCNLQGDLSLILPEIGLVPVPTRQSATKLREIGLPSELERNLFQPKQRISSKLNDTGLEFQLNNSVLRFGPEGMIAITPGIDIHDIVYRLGNTGCLMSFDSLAFKYKDGKFNVKFFGGKIWKVRGES